MTKFAALTVAIALLQGAHAYPAQAQPVCKGVDINTSDNPSLIITDRATRTLVARAPPASFTANPNIGPGGSSYRDSAHFRVYASDLGAADRALSMLEGVYSCFVDTLGWRSTGLSYNDNNDNDGPWVKVNIYSVANLPGAAGVMHSDFATGMAWLEVANPYLVTPVTIHEFGHGLHYHQKTWVNQGRTGAWWETLANWVSDTFLTSPLCANARSQYGQATPQTSEIDVIKTIGDSFQVIVDGSAGSGNYYQAWPFFTYITNNPDNFAGLGRDVLRQLMVRYSANSNETPLHTLQRVSTGATVARIVGKYWARMAYLDIGHTQARTVFLNQRSRINYANVDSAGSGTYRVKSARRPRYMGANIIPLKNPSGTVTVRITTSGQLTSHLVVRNTGSGAVRYVELSNGQGSVSVAGGEEASLVVANTPANLILFDPFSLGSDVNTGVDYSFTLSGATA
ncbi:dockerin type 1 [Colletotrichum truncatum]|uniref:Dockerin type 1 n=1 Tax=Colletotrichum truncatum TaxID=5467 RepID=A0ACC3Z8X3_COLTU|nr:dockerin type 1 [Colletotrichum truncatum]XP_036574497.1 dockerin type 1 [Colletotrichum truncatum]KAF6780561.1 dockerin type 1 [Colletotrichum truncatum]KAF6780940.1 dockerin type 1 [Colletotrichum truncatum]